MGKGKKLAAGKKSSKTKTKKKTSKVELEKPACCKPQPKNKPPSPVSSGFPRDHLLSLRECRPGVSIKDVGVDIAGFLIEEEIRKNKEKLKMEIIRQIALSKELDKHLERQRRVMSNYIRHNNSTCRNHLLFPDKCNCMVCQEAAFDDDFGCCCPRRPPECPKKIVSRSKCVCFDDSRPTYSDCGAQATPDPDLCQECNNPKKVASCSVAIAAELAPKCTPLLSRQTNTEPMFPFFQDYSCVQEPTCSPMLPIAPPSRVASGSSELRPSSSPGTPNKLSVTDVAGNRSSTPEIVATRKLAGQSKLPTPENPVSRVSTADKVNPKISFVQTQTTANQQSGYATPTSRISTFDRQSSGQSPANNRISFGQTQTTALSDSQSRFNKSLGTTMTPEMRISGTKVTPNEGIQVDMNRSPCKCIGVTRPRDAQTEAQPRLDSTEMILANIKNIIKDYMDNMSRKCSTCQSESPSPPGDDKKLVKIDDQPPKSDIDTNIENDGTHIDIVMEFCEINKKKRAILEIEPCFDTKRCIKYNKKEYVRDAKPHRRRDDDDDDNVDDDEDNFEYRSRTVTPCHSGCPSRVYNPYRTRDHHSHCPTYRSARQHRQRKHGGGTHAHHKSKKCMPSIMYNDNNSTHSNSSNDSVKFIQVNKYSNSEGMNVFPSSASNASCDDKHCAKPKRSSLKKHKKSAFSSYVTNIVELPSEHSKHRRKKASQTSVVVKYSKPKKHEHHHHHHHKSSKKTDYHRTYKTNTVLVSSFHEHVKKEKKHKKVSQPCCTEPSVLDETSYKKIVPYEKPKHAHSHKKKSKHHKTSTTTLVRETSNNEVTAKDYARKDNETTLCSYPSDILSSIVPTSEQLSISAYEDKEEILGSSNLLDDTQLEEAIKQNIKTWKHEASTSSNAVIEKSEITPVKKHHKATLTNYNDIETDSSGDEVSQADDLNSYPKISSDGGVVILSPLFKKNRIQLIRKWLAYMHKLQGKEHFKTIAPAIVAIKLPSSSKYVLPNENSEEQVEYMLTHKDLFNEVLENTAFGRNKKYFVPVRPDTENSLYDVPNTTTESSYTNKWTKQSKTVNRFDEIEKPFRNFFNRHVTKKSVSDFKKSKSEVLCTTSSSTCSDYNIVGSSASYSSFESTTESLLDVHENNHDELIKDLICPYRDSFKGKYFNVTETDRIINRAFYIQDIFVNLANTDEEKDYWRDTVLRAMKNIVTNTS